MRFIKLLSSLPLVAATCTSVGSVPTPVPEVPGTSPNPGPQDCCGFTYKPLCTMNLERTLHIQQFYNRKPGMSPEDFNAYWANHHANLAQDFHVRMGVIKMNQYHTTPEYRDLLRVEGVPPLLEFDGAAEYWVRDIYAFAAMGADPYYRDVIQPDEPNFIDMESFRIIAGVDYILVEQQNPVEEHGRTF